MSSSPPPSWLVRFSCRRLPAKVRTRLRPAKISSAREIQRCDSSCAIDEHCTRPEAPKIRTPPTCAAGGLVLVRGTTCQVGSFSGGRRGAMPGAGPVGVHLGAARASAGEKEQRLSRRARGPARHLGQERPSIVDLGPEIRWTCSENNWHRGDFSRFRQGWL